ncbi:hypothetical protein [Rubritalea tangerina]
MVLLILLVVGMLGLATSETKVATQEKHRMEARANARMALIIALGELQEAAGKDERVTAESDIIEGARQKHTMGVWRSLGCRIDPLDIENRQDHIVGGDLTAGEIGKRMAETYEGEGRASRFLK